MKYLYTLTMCLLISAMAHAQNFENSMPIKKAKKRTLNAFVTINTSTSTVKYKQAYWEFDTNGNLISKIEYDKSGKTVLKLQLTYKKGKLIESLKEKVKLSELEKVIYTYNKLGNMIKKSEYRNDKLVIYYQYYYALNHRLDSIIWYDKTNKAQLYEYHKYEDGLLTNIIEKTSYGRLDGKTECYYYPNGELKEEKLYDGFGEMYEHMDYNEKGSLTERKLIRDKKVTTYSYSYSGNGLIKSKKKIVSDNPQAIIYKYKWGKKIITD